MNLTIAHHLFKRESLNTIDTLIQNLITLNKVSPQTQYLLFDSAENLHTLSSVQTLQQHFPNLIFSKIEKDSGIQKLAKGFGAQHLLIITNNNFLNEKELIYVQKMINMSKKQQTFYHREISLRAEKSIWKKFLLYFKYES